MPVFNTMGLPIQLVVQPSKSFSDLAASLQPGQVMRGRVSEVLADGKAVVNFRGVAVTAELKGVSLARGEVISVSVQDLKGQPTLRLLPQAPALASPQAAESVQLSAMVDAETAAVLANLNLPRDGFHAAVVQLLQGYSVPPSRESVASVKELLAALPAFLEQPVSPAPATGRNSVSTVAAAQTPVPAPAQPPVHAVPVSTPLPAQGGALRPMEAAPATPVPAQTVPVAPVFREVVSAPARVAEPPLPQPAVNAVLSRGYNIGRLLAAIDSETPAAQAANSASRPSVSQPPVPVATAPQVQPGIPAANAPVRAPATVSPAPAAPGVPVSSTPVQSAPPKAGGTPPAVSTDATAVARVLADAASLNGSKPLPAIIESAVQAMESIVQGKTELPAEVHQALTDLARDLASLLENAGNARIRDLGTAAGRVNEIIRSMPGGDQALQAPAPVSPGGYPLPAGPAGGAAAQQLSMPAPVRSAAELAGALAGIIHEEVAQAIQPQVTIVASAVMAPQAGVEAARIQMPQARTDSGRAGIPAPVHDSELGGARTEAPRSAMPAPVALPSAVHEADAPVDVPRIMAVVAETAPVVVFAEDLPDSVRISADIPLPARVAPTEAQAQVLSGGVVNADARNESLPAALARSTGAPEPPPMPVPRDRVTVPSAPQAQSEPVRDPRVGFMPPLQARDAAGLYGATSAGGARINQAETAQAGFVPAPGGNQPVPADARISQAPPAFMLSGQSGQVQIGRDVVETAVFMHAFNLPPAREVARASHEYLFGGAHLNETIQGFEDAAASAGARSLPAPVREAVEHAIQVVRDVRVTMEGDEVSASRLQGAVEKLGLGHESRLARAAGQDGEPRPTRQESAQVVRGAQDSLKAAMIELRGRVEAALVSTQSSQGREELGALRSSADDVLQVVQSQQVGSVSRSAATQVMYVQLPIQVGNEMRGGEVHLSWKKDGEGRNRRRDPRAPATMSLNMETRALGPVRVRMQMTGQNLSLVFQVNDPSVQAFLSGEFSGLKDRLEGFSLRVDRCVAEVSREEAMDDAPRAVAPTSTVDFRA